MLQVVVVDPLDSKDLAHLTLLDRTELGITFTKVLSILLMGKCLNSSRSISNMSPMLQINCWKLTQFSKAVFLDADTLVLKNSDELFDREEFSAAPGMIHPIFLLINTYVLHPVYCCILDPLISVVCLILKMTRCTTR